MKGKLRIVLTVILGAVFLVSSGLMLRQYLGDREVEGTYQEALELALAAPAAELAAAPTMAAVTEPLWPPHRWRRPILTWRSCPGWIWPLCGR